MRRLITALALLCMVPVALAQRPAELDFPLDHQRLQKGEMQTETKVFEVEGVGEKKVVIGVQLIDAPAERLWAVISHVEGQKAYVPNLERFDTILTKRSRPGYRNILANVELDVPFVKVRYTLDMEIDHATRSLRWALVDKDAARAYQARNIPALRASGGLQSVVGRSFIEPYPRDPGKSLYYYVNYVQTDMPVPGFVERMLTTKTLRNYMASVKVQVERSTLLGGDRDGRGWGSSQRSSLPTP
jgi:hypothetical protein